MGMSTVPDFGEVQTHYHHIFRKTGTARTQSKTGMVTVTNLGDVHTICVDTVIILLYVTNMTTRRSATG